MSDTALRLVLYLTRAPGAPAKIKGHVNSLIDLVATHGFTTATLQKPLYMAE